MFFKKKKNITKQTNNNSNHSKFSSKLSFQRNDELFFSQSAEKGEFSETVNANVRPFQFEKAKTYFSRAKEFEMDINLTNSEDSFYFIQHLFGFAYYQLLAEGVELALTKGIDLHQYNLPPSLKREELEVDISSNRELDNLKSVKIQLNDIEFEVRYENRKGFIHGLDNFNVNISALNVPNESPIILSKGEYHKPNTPLMWEEYVSNKVRRNILDSFQKITESNKKNQQMFQIFQNDKDKKNEEFETTNKNMIALRNATLEELLNKKFNIS